MLLPLVAALTGGLAVAFVVLALGDQRSRSQVLLAVLGNVRSAPQPITAAAPVLRHERLSSVTWIDALLSRREWSHRVATELAQAGLRVSVGAFVLLRLLLIAGSVVAVITMTGMPLLSLPAAVVAAWFPSSYLKRARGRRIGRLEQQLPEVLILLSNAVKSGFGLMQALQHVADELDDPLGGGRTVLRDVALGTPVEEALERLTGRVPSESLEIVTTAIVIQRSAGGNLADILESVAATIRDRDRIRGEIRTLTTQQLYTGYLLALLPVGIAGIISIMSPGYMEPLFSTGLGRALVGGAVAMDLMGFLVIRRILSIEV